MSLDSNGTRHARSVIHLPLFTLPQHTRRELETTPGHKTQQPPSPGILQMGLHLWACSVWRWGAFDGPSPSRNAGSVCMVTGDLHTRTSNTSVEHAPRETRGTMQLTDGRDRLNACNYDWPRKGPIAIVRSAARRGADRTARARCVQQTNINSLNFCLAITWCGGQPVVHVSYGISRERPIPGGAVEVCARATELHSSSAD